MVSRRVRIFIWIAAIAAVAAIAIAAATAFIVLRTVHSTPAAEAAAADAFNEVRKLYPNRPPLIEVKNARAGQVHINRAPQSPRKTVDTIYFMYWQPEDQKIVRGEAPTWVTSLRVSIFGVGNWSFSDLHITREDIERYSPGILIDFTAPEGAKVLAWTK